MNLSQYTAEHVLRFDLDTPVTFRDHEVDRIRIDFMWCAATPEDGTPEGGQPAGWWVSADLKGWPLTAKGKRDKRIKAREGLGYVSVFPRSLRPAFDEAITEALKITGIEPGSILNPEQGMLNDGNWEPAPLDVFGGNCTECGIEVGYTDGGMWPWRGVDGSTTCSASGDSPWGHRLNRSLADKIFATHERLTGNKARHF